MHKLATRNRKKVMENVWLLSSLVLSFATPTWATSMTKHDEFTSLKEAFHQLSVETNKQVNSLRERVEVLEKEHFKKDQVIAGLQKALDISETHEVTPSIIKANIHKRTASSTVAFHTCFTNNANYLGRNQILLFDKVVTDTHSSYTRSAGSYSIPATGFYVITWVTPVLGNIPFELVINGQPRGRTDPSNTHNGQTQSTTGIAVLSLYENDNISIRTNPGVSPTGVLVNNEWQDCCLSLWKI